MTHLLDNTLLVHDVRLKPQHSKHYQSGQDGGDKVDDGDERCIKVTVVVTLVVAGESDDTSEAQTKGEEDLSGSFSPHLRLQHLFQLKKKKDKRCQRLLIHSDKFVVIHPPIHQK